ncbi:HAD family hydrolase [Ligilactobacillus saerimneri]|uniref:HAD family hydrolase n=1 Tax=Ligilactobacillus saerimneri TaxID=228229 RepID=UPI003F283066
MWQVFFDLDDTIYDQAQPFKIAFAKAFPQIKIDNWNQLYQLFRQKSDEVFPLYPNDREHLEEMWIDRMNRTLSALNEGNKYDSVMILEFQKIYNQQLKQIVMFPEMRKLLVELRNQKIQVGIISNGSYEHQMNKVTALGLQDYVAKDRIFISATFGVSKPDPELFRKVGKEIGRPTDEMIYVGDNYLNDVYAATQAGCKATIWFNHRQREVVNKPVMVTLEIKTPEKLFQIANLVKNLNN